MAAALDDCPDMRIVGTATNAQRTLQLMSTDQCDVLLITPNLPKEGAIELVEALKEQQLTDSIKVLIVGMPDNPTLLMRYFQAGVAGYVLRTDTVDDLVRNIRAANEGRALVSPKVAAAMMTRISDLAENVPQSEQSLENLQELTPREKEVLHLIGEGFSNRQIADRLTIELGTVKNHVHSILEKLDVANRQEAARQWEHLQDDFL
jgi:DNA-binding NarL/FixJ family response regulator